MLIAARAITATFLVGLLGAPLPSALAGSNRLSVPPDSFIRQHVASVPQLTQQVTLDPVVRRRLARHFHVSGPAMVHYIQNNLTLKQTTLPRRYLVYCVTPSGREYTVWSRLPAGTPIFVLKRTGQPILKLACGNPLVSALPSVEQFAHRGPGQPHLANLLHTAKAPTSPLMAVNARPTIALTAKNILPVLPKVKVASFPLQALGGGGGGGSLGYLAFLPFLSPLFNGNGSGNSGVTPFAGTTGTGIGTGAGTNGTNTGTPFGGTTGTANTGLVPESSGLVNMASVLLAVAVVGVVGKVRKRLRKKTPGRSAAL